MDGGLSVQFTFGYRVAQRSCNILQISLAYIFASMERDKGETG